MKIAIIGAGPAGLLAAWGVYQAGAMPYIIDRDPAYRPDRLFSLQYLHTPCDLPTEGLKTLTLRYDVIDPFGFPEDWKHLYNFKLGRPRDDENSTKFLSGPPQIVWSLKTAYRYLHHEFEGHIHQDNVTWDRIINAADTIHKGVINTAPLDRLLPALPWPHRSLLIKHGYTPVEDHPEDTCVYNLDPKVPWYRATRLDGGTATEFCGVPRGEDVKDFQLLRKVVKSDVMPEYLPENLLLTGRWGSWDPAKLTHDAYYDAKKFTEGLM